MTDLATIKSNVKSMLDQGASEAEVDLYLNHVGVTPDQLQKSSGAAYQGQVLPFRVDEQGKPHLAVPGLVSGAVESVKDAVTLPRDYMQGKVDPTSDEGIGRMLNMGAMITPVSPATRATMPYRPGRPQTPTARELQDLGSAQYEAVRNAGVDYHAAPVARIAADIQRQLEQDGILDIASGAPQTHQLLRQLQAVPAGGNPTVPIANLEAARRAAQTIATSRGAENTERGAASRLVQAISQHIEAADPATVVGGASPDVARTAAEAGQTLGQARGNYGAYLRSNYLTDQGWAADLSADAANSGLNAGNATRQRLKNALINDRLRGFNDAEAQAVEDVVRGSGGVNRIRYLSNLLGGGGGLGAVVSGGGLGAAAGHALIGNPEAGAAAGAAAGLGLKMAEGAMVRRQVRGVDEMLRQRSPLYQGRAANPPMVQSSPAQRAFLLKMMLLNETAPKAIPKAYDPYES